MTPAAALLTVCVLNVNVKSNIHRKYKHVSDAYVNRTHSVPKTRNMKAVSCVFYPKLVHELNKRVSNKQDIRLFVFAVGHKAVVLKGGGKDVVTDNITHPSK